MPPRARRKQFDTGRQIPFLSFTFLPPSFPVEFGAFLPYNLTSGGIKFTNFPENQLTTRVCIFSTYAFCLFHVHESSYAVNIRILVCQIIGPAAAASAGPVPTPVLRRHVGMND